MKKRKNKLIIKKVTCSRAQKNNILIHLTKNHYIYLPRNSWLFKNKKALKEFVDGLNEAMEGEIVKGNIDDL